MRLRNGRSPEGKLLNYLFRDPHIPMTKAQLLMQKAVS